jgi:hypothetical protein
MLPPSSGYSIEVSHGAVKTAFVFNLAKLAFSGRPVASKREKNVSKRYKNTSKETIN